MSEIDTVVTGPDAEQAILDTLESLLPVYLADRAAANGKPRSTYKVASYARAATLDTRFPNEYLPCVTTRATTKTNRDVHGSSGAVASTFTVLVGVLLADQSRESTEDLAWEYLAAVEACLWQHGALGGFAEATIPGDTEIEDIPVDRQRTLAGGSIEVQVLVPQSVNVLGGPVTPPEDPYEPLPTDPQVESVDIDITRA